MKISARIALFVLVAFGLPLFIYWQTGGFKAKIEPEDALAARTHGAPGNVVKAEAITLPVVEEAVGTIQSRHRVDVSPRISAAIVEVGVNAGERVEEGQLLVRLDPRDLEARVGQAEQALQAAVANAKQAVTDYTRTRDLLSRKVISMQEAENARLRVEVTSATVGEARRAVEQASVQRSYAEIRSPVAGIVVEKLQDSGDTARPGQPVVTLYDPSLVRLEVPVREALARRLKVGQAMEIRLGDEDRVLTGTVDEIVPQAEEASRSILVKVLVPGASELYTGMYGTLRIPTGEERVLVVPQEAVERVGQLEYVAAVGEQGAERRFVQTGRKVGENVEILAGLSQGEGVSVAQDEEGAQ